MSDQQAFEKLKDFFENRPVCVKAADPLRKNVEIGIVINNHLDCAFFKEGDQPRFAQRAANNPDVIFYISPDGVESLVSHPSNDIAELGIHIAKAYLAKTVKIKIQGSMLKLLTNGYLGVIKGGGVAFTRFLAAHGVSGLSKIKDVFQQMRDKK